MAVTTEMGKNSTRVQPAGVADRVALTIIVPVLNEQDSLEQLWKEICLSADTSVGSWELVFIDDGSTDHSWSVIEQLSKRDSRVSGIRLRRNFGKAAALTAGMQAARGDLILMMDADLQDDPAELPAFLAKIEEGADVVNGWKQQRRDPWHKVYPSRVFNWMASRLSGLQLHDHNCGLKMFRSDVAAEIQIYGELHRFIPVLAFARGFRVTEAAVNHRARQHGVSKYGVRRFVRGLLDLLTVTFLTSFGRRPLHALGGVGLFFFGLGVLGMIWLAALWCLMNIAGVIERAPIGNRPLLAYSVAATLLGGQALSLGLLAELIVAHTGNSGEAYSIAEQCGGGGRDSS